MSFSSRVSFNNNGVKFQPMNAGWGRYLKTPGSTEQAARSHQNIAPGDLGQEMRSLREQIACLDGARNSLIFQGLNDGATSGRGGKYTNWYPGRPSGHSFSMLVSKGNELSFAIVELTKNLDELRIKLSGPKLSDINERLEKLLTEIKALTSKRDCIKKEAKDMDDYYPRACDRPGMCLSADEIFIRIEARREATQRLERAYEGKCDDVFELFSTYYQLLYEARLIFGRARCKTPQKILEAVRMIVKMAVRDTDKVEELIGQIIGDEKIGNLVSTYGLDAFMEIYNELQGRPKSGLLRGLSCVAHLIRSKEDIEKFAFAFVELEIEERFYIIRCMQNLSRLIHSHDDYVKMWRLLRNLTALFETKNIEKTIETHGAEIKRIEDLETICFKDEENRELVRKYGLKVFIVVQELSESARANTSEALKAFAKMLKAGINAKEATSLIQAAASAGWGTDEARKGLFQSLKARLGITDKFLEVIENLGFKKEVLYLLNDPKTPVEQRERIALLARNEIQRSWAGVLNGRPPEELPRIFEFCARVMAEKALFAYEKIKTIATQTKKPTINIYVLSTGYKLRIERLADQFKEQGLARHEITEKLRQFHQAVMAKVGEGMPHMEARLEVGREWLKDGRLMRFTMPVFLKISSGSHPCQTVEDKLGELAALAKEKNYDLIFIDHSTVRTRDVIHSGDPSDFEKGRALARGIDIVDPENKLRRWVYKVNNWDVPGLSNDQPNMVAINLYDGRIYEAHTGGHKSDWLPIDDHGEFVGVQWDADGVPERTNYFVITKNSEGCYSVGTAEHIFNQSMKAAVEKLKTPSQKAQIPFKNIVFVCNANHDRSPLAEHLMRNLLNRHAINAEQIQVSSAGLIVDDWLKTEGTKKQFPFYPSSGTRSLLEQRQLDFSAFKKRQVDEGIVSQADMIFVMTEREKKELIDRHPAIAEKVKVLREFAGYAKEDRDLPTPKTFNYQTIYIFEEALERAIKRMAGEEFGKVRRIPKGCR